MRDSFLVFAAPLIEEDEISEVVACLRSGWVGTGPRAALFESEFAAYKGGGYATAVNSCTAALHVSLLAAGMNPGDEVITTALTFCSTVNAIIHAGLTPVLADVEPGSMNIDPSSVERLITSRTRALLPVHFAGRPCNMDELERIARRHNLVIIEDCAHAIEAEYKGRRAGTMGQFGCFSFYVTKNVITAEGGLILTQDQALADRCRIASLHGMSRDAWKRFSSKGFRHYEIVECGFKYNMSDLQASLGIHQLRKIEARWERRRQIWDRYMAAFQGLDLGLPAPIPADTRHAYHLFTILIDRERLGVDRDVFLDRMTLQQIGVGVHYVSVADHNYYADRFGWRPEDVPVATKIGRETVSVPLSAKLTDADVDDVIDAVRMSLAD